MASPGLDEGIERLTMTFKTINDGEQALILNNRGRARVVVGPQRVSVEMDRCHQDEFN